MINFEKVFKRYPGNMDALQNINLEIVLKLAPKVVEGTKRLKDWAEST